MLINGEKKIVLWTFDAQTPYEILLYNDGRISVYQEMSIS